MWLSQMCAGWADGNAASLTAGLDAVVSIGGGQLDAAQVAAGELESAARMFRLRSANVAPKIPSILCRTSLLSISCPAYVVLGDAAATNIRSSASRRLATFQIGTNGFHAPPPRRLVATPFLSRNHPAVVTLNPCGHCAAALPWANGDATRADADGGVAVITVTVPIVAVIPIPSDLDIDLGHLDGFGLCRSGKRGGRQRGCGCCHDNSDP
jgi:hypothetical protein